MLLILSFLACAEETDRADDIAALTGDAAAGEALYESSCASCHLSDGTGDFGPDLTGESDTTSIVNVMLEGNDAGMPPFDDLADQDLADIAAHVISL